MQAASASAPGLKAPSSLAVGAAIPTTKQAVFSQAGAARPTPTEAGRDNVPSSAAVPAGKASQPAAAAAVATPDKPAVERRSLEGLDDTVANGLRALCQVSHHSCTSELTVGCCVCIPRSLNKVVAECLAGSWQISVCKPTNPPKTLESGCSARSLR